MDKEKEISDLGKQIKDNENKLNKLLKGIAVDTEVIKELEEQLAKGDQSLLAFFNPGPGRRYIKNSTLLLNLWHNLNLL